MQDTHDHSLSTHAAKCDLCEYVAQTHAHDEEDVVNVLCQDLAIHNKTEHNIDTDPQSIKDAVRAKMQTLS